MLKGNEGLTMAGKEIVWITGLDLYLKSVVSKYLYELCCVCIHQYIYFIEYKYASYLYFLGISWKFNPQESTFLRQCFAIPILHLGIPWQLPCHLVAIAQ